MSKPTTVFSVDGFEVTATFAENHNAIAVHHVKHRCTRGTNKIK